MLELVSRLELILRSVSRVIGSLQSLVVSLRVLSFASLSFNIDCAAQQVDLTLEANELGRSHVPVKETRRQLRQLGF